MAACGSQRVDVDLSGVVILKRLVEGARVAISAVGYSAAEFLHDGRSDFSIALRPNTLRGEIRDSLGGELVNGAAVSVVSLGKVITSSVTEADGRYSFLNLPSSPVKLVVSAVDCDRFEIEVGPLTEIDVYLDPFKVRGIYMPLGILVSRERVQGLVDLVRRTKLNTIVVDVKNDRGWLAYPSEVAAAVRSGAYRSEVMDVGEFLSLCHENNIYVIARLVVFKDSTLVSAYPQWAVRTKSGELWRDSEGSSWGDPFREEVQSYNIAVAREVAALGFDELQFDYLRFPSDGAVQETRYQRESTRQSRCDAVEDFCARLERELEPYPVLLSADVFGLTVWVSPEEDMGIGQRIIDIAPYMDYISPMLYPATFAPGSLGYDEPVLHPYEVVYRSCIELAKRTTTPIRPWLQHYRYTVGQMRLQREAAGDATTEGWMFWNAAGRYDEGVFDPAQLP
jgi:hypothetical protein